MMMNHRYRVSQMRDTLHAAQSLRRTGPQRPSAIAAEIEPGAYGEAMPRGGRPPVMSSDGVWHANRELREAWDDARRTLRLAKTKRALRGDEE